jgi:ABC-type sugar transport system ATPase subunit
MTLSARENITLTGLALARRRLALARFDRRAEKRETEQWISRVELQPPLPERPLQLFSGGNQQKIVIAKCLNTRPRVLLLDEPTQGVDVGAKVAIYSLINDAAASGTGILVSSSDLKELMTLCDRVLVLRDGRVAAELQRHELSEARLVRENLGLSDQEEAELQPTLDVR